jgi:hypothetical protein
MERPSKTMIQQDEDSLKRILGLDEIPKSVEDEYDVWIRMFHRDGNSGPLGTIGLIGLSRQLGMSPPPKPAAPEAIDWRQYPTNGSVGVEANLDGVWKPGVFKGFVQHGTLEVLLDENNMGMEFMPRYVRYVGPRGKPVTKTVPARVEKEEAVAEEATTPWEPPQEPPQETEPERVNVGDAPIRHRKSLPSLPPKASSSLLK